MNEVPCASSSVYSCLSSAPDVLGSQHTTHPPQGGQCAGDRLSRDLEKGLLDESLAPLPDWFSFPYAFIDLEKSVDAYRRAVREYLHNDFRRKMEEVS